MANSFKQMTRSGVIKRTDTGMFISLDDIHIREDFNKRDYGDERNQQADDDLFNYLMAGGVVPPIEVTARDDGGVYVVEGHRRTRAYLRCREAGKPADRIHIMPFNGNDIQRLARIMTSNNQLALAPIEQAGVVQEMANTWNLSVAEIAKLIHKSQAKVEQLLTLSIANHDVQQAVKSGAVSVDVAVDRVKEHGESAGKVLEQDQAKAAAAGKKKVTRSVIAPQLSVGKLRRVMEILTTGEFYLDGWRNREDGCEALIDELVSLINEHKALKGDA